MTLTIRQQVLHAYLQALIDCTPLSILPVYARASVFNDPELAAFAALRLF